jgi:hypothetical protein
MKTPTSAGISSEFLKTDDYSSAFCAMTQTSARSKIFRTAVSFFKNVTARVNYFSKITVFASRV